MEEVNHELEETPFASLIPATLDLRLGGAEINCGGGRRERRDVTDWRLELNVLDLLL